MNGGRWWVVGLLMGICAFAQSGPASLGNNGCAGGPAQPRLAAIIPVTLPDGAVVAVPVCIVLGPGITLNTAVNPMQLTVTAAAPAMRGVVERFPLDPATAQATSTLNVVLRFMPLPGWPIFFSLKSSVLGADSSDAVLAGAVNGKNISIALPLYRPFTAADQILVTYWTVEP